jgi:hypothetical protein
MFFIGNVGEYMLFAEVIVSSVVSFTSLSGLMTYFNLSVLFFLPLWFVLVSSITWSCLTALPLSGYMQNSFLRNGLGYESVALALFSCCFCFDVSVLSPMVFSVLLLYA